MTADPVRADGVAVRDAPEAGRFEVWMGDELAGFTRYEPRGDGVYAFVHTEVDPRFEGRGLAGRLVGEALDEARRRGWSVLPYCPYVRRYLARHPELVDLVPEADRPRFDL